MEIITTIPDSSDVQFVTLTAPGTFIGAAVSAIVFTTLTTTGEIAASATSTGIELTGNAIAYGTELAVGTLAATTVRTLARSYGAIAKPAISNTSRLGALGISFLAGAGAALMTSVTIYGGRKAGSYLYSWYDYTKDAAINKIGEYKQQVAAKIQYPIETSTTILLENDIQVIEESPLVLI